MYACIYGRATNRGGGQLEHFALDPQAVEEALISYHYKLLVNRNINAGFIV